MLIYDASKFDINTPTITDTSLHVYPVISKNITPGVIVFVTAPNIDAAPIIEYIPSYYTN